MHLLGPIVIAVAPIVTLTLSPELRRPGRAVAVDPVGPAEAKA
jgi:hypothetical protein